MLTSDFEKVDDKDEPAPQIKLIFAYYCKLNSKKTKHKMFEDFNEKAETMNLHEFMTFSKNFQITTKQHKRIDNNILSQFLESKREQHNSKGDGSIKKNDVQEKQGQNSIKNPPKQENPFGGVEKQQSQIVQNQFLKVHDKNSITEGQGQTQKALQLPTLYLNEKKLAEIFKRETSQQGQINFDIFLAILRKISQEMYVDIISQVKVTQNVQSNSANLQDSKEIVIPKSQQKGGAVMKLLRFLNLDCKYHIMETFAKVNEFYGTMEHLSFMRSPIKKLNLKNDPLGKHTKKNEANKQNTSKSRLNFNDKGDKSLQRLPRVTKPNMKKDLITYAKNDIKSIKKEQLSVFMLANRSQIEHLNKSYLKNIGNLISQDTTKRDNSIDPESKTFKAYPITNQKSTKKYSQRHKDKVIGDINHKQIGKLIDVSSLYDDQIFNKYVELNYKNAKNHQIK